MLEEEFDVDGLIDALIEREGGFANHPADKGGPTCFGITEAVARAHGYAGAMRNLPRDEAAAIYRRLYWLRPRFDQVAQRSSRIASELFDTGVNMGPAVATTFLQRALTALNRNCRDYADLTRRVTESQNRRLFIHDVLLKGRYTVSAYLLCERALNVLSAAEHVLTLEVEQDHLEQGMVTLPRDWTTHAGADEEADHAQDAVGGRVELLLGHGRLPTIHRTGGPTLCW